MTAVKKEREDTSKVYREMTVHGFELDSIAQLPMVLLKDADENNTIPIWISATEAVSIAAELINRDVMAEKGCRDLMTTLFDQLRVGIGEITIEALDGSTFEAYATFSHNGEDVRVKVRPCEAIVIALKYAIPILIAEDIIARAAVMDVIDDDCGSLDVPGRFVDLLEKLDPKDMGKYPM